MQSLSEDIGFAGKPLQGLEHRGGRGCFKSDLVTGQLLGKALHLV